jgi:hypothetical protein
MILHRRKFLRFAAGAVGAPAIIRQSSALDGYQGQVKPSGIPIINSQHPFAQGLLFYGFDTGMRSYVNLCGSGPIIYGAQRPPVITRPYGTGFNWPGSLAGNNQHYGAICFTPDETDPAGQIARATNLSNQGAGAGWSFVCGYIQSGFDVQFGWIFGRPAWAGEIQPYANWGVECPNNGTQINFFLNHNGALSRFGSNDPEGLNRFVSCCGTAKNDAPGSATATAYVNGVRVGYKNCQSVQNSNVNAGVDPEAQIMFGAIYHYYTTFSYNCFQGVVYYGGFLNRALDPDEVMQWHQNPYSFLLPGT